jgi:hypothetical protein
MNGLKPIHYANYDQFDSLFDSLELNVTEMVTNWLAYRSGPFRLPDVEQEMSNLCLGRWPEWAKEHAYFMYISVKRDVFAYVGTTQNPRMVVALCIAEKSIHKFMTDYLVEGTPFWVRNFAVSGTYNPFTCHENELPVPRHIWNEQKHAFIIGLHAKSKRSCVNLLDQELARKILDLVRF